MKGTPEVAVVGAGSAGLYAALTAAREGARTVLVSQAALATTASYWAQGGIAAALGEDDSIELHQADTLAAGRQLGRVSAVRALVTGSPGAVEDLITLGVDFDREDGHLALGLEGGHSRRRVVHAGGSATGRRITRQLSAMVAEHPLIDVIEHASAKALVLVDGRCVGVRVEVGGESRTIAARAILLATGGSAALWARSTNPPAAVGSGLLMAHAAGADLADLEFLQFHPTALLSPSRNQGFLITEATRGEGATLVDQDGERFVDELAARDEVAAAVERKIAGRDGAASPVFLDLRQIDPVLFPNVFGKIEEAGIDPRTDLVPIAPAAHYTMGGIVADINGRTTVPGLLAVGECSCTGLHGANRLASNSLAECMVFGRRAALSALAELSPPEATLTRVAAGELPASEYIPDPDPAATRELLWTSAGIERTAEGLSNLAASPNPLVRLIGANSLAREETRGAHHRSDFPEIDHALDFQHFVTQGEQAPVAHRWE
ncbi:MAG: FAD-binding protein [Solirubrobacteraceae bacterium]|nr:FAD-binding protein [Solirubrobacteraceae bacterium]